MVSISRAQRVSSNLGALVVLLVPLATAGCVGLSGECRQEAQRVSNLWTQKMQVANNYANALTNSLSDGEGFSSSENIQLDRLIAESDRLDDVYEAAKSALITTCGPDIEQEYILP